MTDAALAALKEELKAEILRELGQKPQEKKRNWAAVKNAVSPKLEQFELSIHEWHQMVNALSTITRLTLKIGNVANIKDEQVDTVIGLVSRVLDAALEHKPTRTEGRI